MFHWAEGWFFERAHDGCVRILKRATAHDDADIVARAEIPPAEWASIVASVSAKGETTRAWEQALAFHQQK